MSYIWQMLEPDTNRELAIKLQYVRQGLEKGQQQLHISQVPPLYEIFTPRRFYKKLKTCRDQGAGAWREVKLIG